MLNLTSLSDDEIVKKYNEALTIVKNGESYAQDRLVKAQRMLNIWKGDIWSEEDLAFFDKIDVTPYNFPVHRTLVNNMVSKQRNRRFSFKVVPYDSQSFIRYKKGREEFAQKNINEFESYDSAVDYFDNYSDDEYARTISTLLNNTRYINKAKFQESECFEQGLITGLDFLKAVFNKTQSKTGISIERRSQRKVFFDESSPEYDPTNWQYVGEVHNLSYQDLIHIYPEFQQEITAKYKSFSNKNSNYKRREDINSWMDFYKFNVSPDPSKLKMVEVWIKEIEPRIAIINKKEQTRLLAKFGSTKEEVIDILQQQVIQDMAREVEESGADINLLDQNQNPGLIDEIKARFDEEYAVEDTFDTVWYKMVLTHDTVFEYIRSPLPHNSHPYYPFYPQFNDGIFFGFLESLEDIIVGLNKALAFRELMMAHGAKGLFVVNANIMSESGYSVDQIAEATTTVGGLIIAKLKNRESLADFILPVTTVGEGIQAINALIMDYDNRLYQISGVNLAQLGVTQGETPTSRYKLQLSEGEGNNGLIFDNFVRSLEGFYNDKVLSLVTFFAKYQKEQAIKILGDGYRSWIELSDTKDYDMFDDAVRQGMCNTVLVPEEDDPQANVEWENSMMQLAIAGAVPIEIAFKYSTKPQRYDILRDIQKFKIKQAQDQAGVEAAYQKIQQLILGSDLSLEQAESLIKKMALLKMKEETEQNGQQKQNAAGAQGGTNMATKANEPNRQAAVIRNEGQNG